MDELGKRLFKKLFFTILFFVVAWIIIAIVIPSKGTQGVIPVVVPYVS